MTHQCSGDAPEAIRRTLQIIGDRWSALILKKLHEGPKRFKDFESEIDDINPRTLSQRLDKLSCEGLIEKDGNTSHSPYKLTQAGTDLDAVIHQMALWGKKHAQSQA